MLWAKEGVTLSASCKPGKWKIIKIKRLNNNFPQRISLTSFNFPNHLVHFYVPSDETNQMGLEKAECDMRR